MKARRMHAGRNYKKWDETDDMALAVYRDNGLSLAECAYFLDRTPAAVNRRLCKLKKVAKEERDQEFDRLNPNGKIEYSKHTNQFELECQAKAMMRAKK